MKKLKQLLLLCSIIYVTPAISQADNAAAFGARENVTQMSLSPDGSKVIFMQAGAGKTTALFIASLDGSGEPKPISASDGEPWDMRWCAWASNVRIVCNFFGVQNIDGMAVPFTRLLSFDTDGGDVKQMGQRGKEDRAVGIRQFDGAIIGWSPNDSGDVLMSRTYVPEQETGTLMASKAEGLGVDLVNSKSLKAKKLERARGNAVDYIADTTGRVRIMETAESNNTGKLTGGGKYFYRTQDSDDWKLFSTTGTGTDALRPVAVDATRNLAYAFKNTNGRDAIYTVSLDGKMTEQLVLANDKVDVANLVHFGRSERVIGAQIVTDKRETILFDEEYKALAKRLGKALPGLPLITMVDASRDEQKILMFAGSDTDAGRYYIYDKGAKKLAEVGQARPALDGKTMSPVKLVTYPAADGTLIPAYLTLPVGTEGKAKAAIVMPHGGPSARDEWGFDWIAQFYAAQGYAVLQPNFRGSSGYGDYWYAENGFKSWRLAIGDVNAAGKWLISQGTVDADKLAIFGWSYGGYAALQSAALDPDLFKAVVAVAPVTDLKLLVEQSERYTSSKLVEDFVGQGEHLVSGSPVLQVAKMKAPVLLFSGDRDLNVDVAQSKAMDSALRKSGKQVELIIYKKLDHQLEDSAARADLLRKSDEFFKKILGLP